MEALLKKQGSTGELIKNFLTNTKKSAGKADYNKGYVQGRIVLLDKYWQKFEKQHDEILECDEDDAEDLSKPYFEQGTHEKIESLYSDAIGFLYQSLVQFETPNEAGSSTSSVTSPQQLQGHIRNQQQKDIKLPRITIPSFSGDFKSWTTFHDLFQSLVVNNTSLSDVERLHHLKSSLTGDAASLLRQFAVQGNNFTPAWDLLNKRFANKKLLLHSEMDRFMSAPKATSFNIESVRRVMDISTECITAINNLIPAQQRYDALVTHIFTKKLDNKTLEAWELSVKGSEDVATFDQLSTFLEEYCRTMYLVHSSKMQDHQPKNTFEKPLRKNSFHSSENSNNLCCAFCEKTHSLYKCFKFRNLTTSERKQFITSKNICSKCLSSSHQIGQCKSSYRCVKCEQPHHLLLHASPDPNPTPSSNTNRQSNSASSSTFASVPTIHTHVALKNERSTLLATALVSVQSKHGDPIVLRALLDQGSEVTFITRTAASLLNLQLRKSSAIIKGIGASAAGKSNHMVRLSISSIYNHKSRFLVDAIIMPKLTAMMPTKLVQAQWPHIENLQLADPKYYETSKVDILLGADIYDELILEGVKKGPKGTPIAQLTALGWILSGKLYASSHQTNSTEASTRNVSNYHTSIENTNICEQLEKFWKLEEVNVARKLTLDEELCESHYKQTHRRCLDGKYEVSLPFKSNCSPTFGDSRQQALSRLLQVEKRLKANPDLKSQYSEFMDEYLRLGHMRPIINNTHISRNTFYLPHHAVIKTSSTSTKLRVVFDASAKSSNGLSLNQTLHVGPSIQQDIFSILLRWRKYNIVITGDVEKMYRQIWVAKPNQTYQRILWRNNKNELQDFELTTITYGTAPAPFLAIRTLYQLAQDEQENYPIAAQKTIEDMYVDDLITGSDSVKESVILHKQMSNMFRSGGLNLRKWASNSPDVLNAIPVADQESTTSLDVCKTEVMKTLGMYWNTTRDIFQFKITMPLEPKTVSKRSLLSDVAKLYDPLGLLAPVIIAAKILFQSLWLLGLDWDESLPTNISRDWLSLRSALPSLTEISIPRWIGTFSMASNIQLHGFCDASNKAYAAVVYCRVLVNGSYRTELLASKTRVAPIKKISLPNLELCGATLLANLLTRVTDSMMFDQVTSFAWTDSTIVLDWLRSNSHKQTFVANRISTILSQLKPDQWNHVRSSDNPADVASRGICPSQLLSHNLWWHGPKWLNSPQTTWPKYKSTKKDESPESFSFSLTKVKANEFLTTFEKFSSFKKLLRVIAYCIRFATNCRTEKDKRPNALYLSANEISSSITCILLCIQKEHFSDEINMLQCSKSERSKLNSLCPFLSDDGLLRVGGRLQNAKIEFSQKHPILLPKDHHITSLIVRDIHLTTLHGGNNLTLATLRMQYWVPSARNLIRKIIHNCVKCHRFTVKVKHQLMSSLPASRVSPSKTFAHTGVDYAGPVDIRMSKHRGKGTFKGYIVVFVCMSTKAIHLELASDLSTKTFIAAFKRFTSRRGLCSNMYSDNGTNFVGADREFRTQFDKQVQMITKEVAEELSMQKIQWHFIPPSTPHFGGLWEAGVKAMKYHLKRILGQSALTYEEFYTLLTQIEANLNSRPLSPMSSDPNDLNVLTPGHFVIGGPLNATPEPSLLNTPDNRLQRWQLIEKLNQDFWKTWSMQYLNELQQRPKKWSTRRQNIIIGDMVIIKDERFPPSCWRLARVVETHPGSDGIVRVVTVRHKSGTMKRPISKLCVLPIDSEAQAQDDLNVSA